MMLEQNIVVKLFYNKFLQQLTSDLIAFPAIMPLVKITGF